jgi:3-hydroxyisobutyrate dehydrogenase
MQDTKPGESTVSVPRVASSRPGRPVAVLGAGTMGSAMARRLLSCGFEVRVWNRSPEPLRALAESGAETFSYGRDAVRGADVVLTLLPTADVVTEVMMDAGAIEAMEAGAVWAQMGTIGLEGVERLGNTVRAKRPDVLFVDAPVSGSRAPAETGELVILASGPEDAKATVDAVFAALGRRTLWLGAAGTGSRMKLVLNTWLAFEVEAAAEALALATRWGMSAEALNSAIGGSPLVSPYAASKLAKMQAEDDSPDFALARRLPATRCSRRRGAGDAPEAETFGGERLQTGRIERTHFATADQPLACAPDERPAREVHAVDSRSRTGCDREHERVAVGSGGVVVDLDGERSQRVMLVSHMGVVREQLVDERAYRSAPFESAQTRRREEGVFGEQRQPALGVTHVGCKCVGRENVTDRCLVLEATHPPSKAR